MSLSIPIIRESGNHPAVDHHVWVSRFESQHDDGGASLGPQSESIWVRGFAFGLSVFGETVRGPRRFEPETRNKIGQLGAYRSLPPSEETIQDAIMRAQAAIAKATGEEINA